MTLVSLVLVGGVVGLLFFNTSMQQASFAATALEAAGRRRSPPASRPCRWSSTSCATRSGVAHAGPADGHGHPGRAGRSWTSTAGKVTRPAHAGHPRRPPPARPPAEKPAVLDPAPIVVEVRTRTRRAGRRPTQRDTARDTDRAPRRHDRARRVSDDRTSATRAGAPESQRTDRRSEPEPSAERPHGAGSLRGSPHVRLRVGFVLIAMVLSLFGARLVQLQGVDPESYAAMAAAEGSVKVALPAERGDILDRNGVAAGRLGRRA